MAFQMKPFNNSIFDMNPSDLFRDFGQGLLNTNDFKTDITERDDAYICLLYTSDAADDNSRV